MEIKMPQLGESITEGQLARWLVTPGQRVAKYQPIAEVITDKVNAEIPAPADGEIATLAIGEGETVQVGTLIATMRADGETAAAATQGGPALAAQGGAGLATQGGPATQGRAGLAARGGAVAVTRGGEAPTGGRYSPAVLRLAQEHRVELSRLTGTGLGGRITRKDVEAFIASGGNARTDAPAPATAAAGVAAPAGVAALAGATAVVGAPAGAAAPAGVGAHASAAATAPAGAAAPLPGDRVIPVDAIRRRIAEKMVQSKHEAPHAWSMVQADVTGLVRLKAAHQEEFRRREGISLSYVPFFIKAVVESLKEYPLLNSQWAGDRIILKQEINISVAVATETALAVPVIKHADRLSIAGLNHAVAELAAKARAGRLTVDDISGGTFTVNNTGAFGSYMSAPIINYPQAAIISFEAITRSPVVLENDAIAIRSIMNICLSLDHRILDGLVCGRFLQAVKERLQAFSPENAALF